MKGRRTGEAAGYGRVAFVCQKCGFESAKWLGRCPGCSEWNTLVEEPTAGSERREARAQGTPSGSPTPIAEVSLEHERRLNVGIAEVDASWGAGWSPARLCSSAAIQESGSPRWPCR